MVHILTISLLVLVGINLGIFVLLILAMRKQRELNHAAGRNLVEIRRRQYEEQQRQQAIHQLNRIYRS